MSEWGAKRRKLAELLKAEGYEMDMILPAQGVYRSSPFHDCYRWEGWGKRPGVNINIYFSSWDTITACVRNGIEIAPDTQWLHGGLHHSGFTVSAKERK